MIELIATLFLGELFFFSSRRRHTRYWRDWSSDVCSSDLRRLRPARTNGLRLAGGADRQADAGHPGQAAVVARRGYDRSEERRVGKECRSRWWPYQSRKEAAKDTNTESIDRDTYRDDQQRA